PIPTAEILVEARAADLARLAFGLRPAVHEFVAHVRLPLADERDLDHDEGLSRTKARRSLRVSVPRGPPRLGDFRADTFKVDAIMAQDGRVDQDFSEAIRVDRAGLSTWARVTEARAAPEGGLAATQVYFRRYDLQIDVAAHANELVESLDRFGVLR